MADEDKTRCGFIALIGAPNAGKSTLINGLVGSKVTIVSRKVQTTRTLIRGIAIVGNSQLIFVDTPGIFSPKRRLDRAMVATAWSGAHDADLVGVLIDAREGIDEEAEHILAGLKEVLATHPGVAEVHLRLQSAGRTRVMRLDQRLRVSPSPALKADLKALLGPSCLTA